ncbi:MAG TPA: thioredoxin TrxC [Gammaproteobacteria bacterium]|nr:thioredoxin TrxC [Gammaproteobacteria bacterium]
MNQTLQIVCPHCHVANPVPAERLVGKPVCGGCRQALFNGQPVDLGVNNFDAHLLRGDLPLLVDFWAPWCVPCQLLTPQFASAAEALEPQLRLAKVNTQIEPTLGQRHDIRSLPTMLLFHHGRELARRSGTMAAAAIASWARHVIESHAN